MDKTWVNLSPWTDEYIHSVDAFLDFLFNKSGSHVEIACLCTNVITYYDNSVKRFVNM